MRSQDEIRRQALRFFARVFTDQVFGDLADPPECSRGQSKQTDAEQDADFPLQPGFTKNTFDSAIRHCPSMLAGPSGYP